jgi:hypothetical protein
MEVGGLENPHKISIQSIRPRGKPLTVVPREDALDALEINLSAIASAIL